MINLSRLVGQRKVMTGFLPLFSIVVPLPTVFWENFFLTVTFQYNWIFLLRNYVNMFLHLRSLFLYCSEVVSCIKLYVGDQSVILRLLREYSYQAAPVRQHLDSCNTPKSTITIKNIQSSNSVSTYHLSVSQLRPSFNTRDKFNSKDFLVRFHWLERRRS